MLVAVVGSTLVLVGGVASAGTEPSRAASTVHLTYVSWSGDHFYNYDFMSKSASSSNVDWPVTILFTNNATVNKAKADMEAWSNHFDGNSFQYMYLYENDGGGGAWDNDGGKKSPSCPAYGLSAPHYRVYGIGTSERLYNTTLGYWVPASTHRDYNECPAINKHHGASEATEELMIADASGHTPVANDKFNLFNPEPYRRENDHTWSSNGLASTIHIP